MYGESGWRSDCYHVYIVIRKKEDIKRAIKRFNEIYHRCLATTCQDPSCSTFTRLRNCICAVTFYWECPSFIHELKVVIFYLSVILSSMEHLIIIKVNYRELKICQPNKGAYQQYIQLFEWVRWNVDSHTIVLMGMQVSTWKHIYQSSDYSWYEISFLIPLISKLDL